MTTAKSKPTKRQLERRVVVTLADRIHELSCKHGSIRAAARVLNIDHVYLHRLYYGEKHNPSAALLRKLGLVKVVSYHLALAALAKHRRAK